VQSAPSKGFRSVAYAAAGLTFLLIIVGGIVRISDSGLGCGPGGSGTHGWPLCDGRVVPLINANMIVEYTHRIVAATVTVLIASLVVMAWRRYRSDRQLFRACLLALGLVLVQATLGGLTVEKGLKEELVATHLGTAMLQIGLLLYIARLGAVRAGSGPPPRERCGRWPCARRWPRWRRSWRAATCQRARCTARRRSTRRPIRTPPAAPTFPAAPAAACCPSGAAARSTSTSRTAPSCT
jgi:heme A synthase